MAQSHSLPPAASPPSPPAPAPFFSSLEELWRWQLEQLGPPTSWTPEERAELEPFYRALTDRLGQAR